MSPVRRDQEGARAIPSWQSWIDEAIAEARDRGEFDDLPGSGQPLRIEESPFAGEWALAFHLLENAGMAPPWMEMSREIREGLAELAALRERTGRYLRDQVSQAQPADAPPRNEVSQPRCRFRWWPRRQRDRRASAEVEPWRPNLAALEAERRRARREYLERAARLDEVIAAYNAWLPDNLRRLQKPRLRAAVAAQEFDAACPPVSDVYGRRPPRPA